MSRGWIAVCCERHRQRKAFCDIFFKRRYRKCADIGLYIHSYVHTLFLSFHNNCWIIWLNQERLTWRNIWNKITRNVLSLAILWSAMPHYLRVLCKLAYWDCIHFNRFYYYNFFFDQIPHKCHKNLWGFRLLSVHPFVLCESFANDPIQDIILRFASVVNHTSWSVFVYFACPAAVSSFLHSLLFYSLHMSCFSSKLARIANSRL